jgi:hypothetical protein
LNCVLKGRRQSRLLCVFVDLLTRCLDLLRKVACSLWKREMGDAGGSQGDVGGVFVSWYEFYIQTLS